MANVKVEKKKGGEMKRKEGRKRKGEKNDEGKRDAERE